MSFAEQKFLLNDEVHLIHISFADIRSLYVALGIKDCVLLFFLKVF